MEIRFRNSTGSTASVALLFYSPDSCSHDGQWGVRGWWVVGPGGTVHVLNTTNRYFCYYAEAADGTVWAGDFGPVPVYRDNFDSCLLRGAPEAIGKVGMRRIDTRGNDTIVILDR